MSIDFQVYGSLDPFYFKVTKNGDGVTGQTFSAGDINLSVDGAAGSDISTEITETTFGLGWYKWTPTTAAQTQGLVIIINIKEVTGTNFDENGFTVATGGNASARFSG